MAWETKELTGSLFRNDDKTEDKHPNAKGQCLIDGVAYWVAAWTKVTKDGAKYQSLQFKPKEEKKPAPKKEAEPFADMADDIPF